MPLHNKHHLEHPTTDIINIIHLMNAWSKKMSFPFFTNLFCLLTVNVSNSSATPIRITWSFGGIMQQIFRWSYLEWRGMWKICNNILQIFVWRVISAWGFWCVIFASSNQSGILGIHKNTLKARFSYIFTEICFFASSNQTGMLEINKFYLKLW